VPGDFRLEARPFFADLGDRMAMAPPDGREAITTRLAAYACVSAQAQEEG